MRRRVDVVERLGRLADERDDRGRVARPRRDERGAPHERRLARRQPCSPMSGTKRTSASSSSRYARLAHARHAHELLRTPRPGPIGMTSRPPTASCASSAAGHLGTARGDDDRVVRCVLRPAERAVAAEHVDVGVAEPREPLAGRSRERLEALDGVDLAREPAQDGRRIARARADLEDALTASKPERLDRQRDDVRLRDRLVVADRERRVLVGELGELRRQECLARDPTKRLEHSRVGDPAAREMSIDHVGPRPFVTFDLDHRSRLSPERRSWRRRGMRDPRRARGSGSEGAGGQAIAPKMHARARCEPARLGPSSVA